MTNPHPAVPRLGRYIRSAIARSVLIGVILFVGCLRGGSHAAEIDFNRQIRPILAEHCLHCHGPDADKREADLRLDREQSAHQGAIVPNQPDASPLLRRVTSDDPDLVMPPPETGKSLTDSQVALLRQWIVEGAPYDVHWAFAPVRRPEVPTTKAEASTDIDRFIVSALEARGLGLSPRVSRRQWLRRVTFDLTGLPPTWDAVEAFVQDTSPEAFEKVVDRLLDSPRYGERWGRHWLDLARYADTHGGSAIGFTRFPFSYTYRDYVIRSFNADVPYDRFVTEQLAADQLKLDENDPALAGLGFLTVGMQYRNPHDLIDDQIDVTTRGLMGLTVACARCHDHKYDRVSTADYYSLYATFASSQPPEMLPVVGQPPATSALADYQKELSKRQVVHEDMARDQAEVMRGRLRMQVGLYLRELAAGTPEQDPSAVFLSYRTDDLRPLVLNRWREYLGELPADDPVFGPWLQLATRNVATAEAEQFGARCRELVDRLEKENGDPKGFANLQRLSVAAPKWNPRVLQAIKERQPQSLADLADVYGTVFAEAHRQWLRSLLEASLEAASGGTIIPDEDPRHEAINSAVNRQLRRHLYHPGTPTAMPDEVAAKLLNRTVRDNLNGKKGAIHTLHLSSPGSPPRAMVLREDPRPDAFHVFRRGNPLDRGEVVEARFLSVLSQADSAPFPDGRRRLALARAIVDPDNPLTRRVVVNWVWQHHFGVGLVRTPDDFGTRGRPPTHPELLDYLAATLLDDGWSLKQLHRRIVLSDVYRQAAVEKPDSRREDPENTLLWRMPRRRLDLESMRDAMLAVSGELRTSLGGRPFEFQSDPIVPRRSVYAFVNRDIISNLASTFDAANPNSCTAKRPETTVPQQALFALNSEFIQDRAAAFARRARKSATGDQRDRVRWMYQQAFARSPAPDELETAIRFLESKRDAAAENSDMNQDSDMDQDAGAAQNSGADQKPAADPSYPADAWQQLAHVLLAANEFVFVD